MKENERLASLLRLGWKVESLLQITKEIFSDDTQMRIQVGMQIKNKN